MVVLSQLKKYVEVALAILAKEAIDSDKNNGMFDDRMDEWTIPKGGAISSKKENHEVAW